MRIPRPQPQRLSALLAMVACVAISWCFAASAGAATTDPIAHDPTVVKQGDYYYAVITGDIATRTYLPIKRSKDLVHWEELGTVFQTAPAWVTAALGTTPGDFWAPDLDYVDGRYRLYYAASQFATNNSVIGLATNATLDPASPDYRWVDEGLVLRSTPGTDEFNAIDAEVATDAQGRKWLAFGSFWTGIKMRRLDEATGKLSTTDTTLHALAQRPAPGAVEGPSILRRRGFYYLFVSFDFCCRGVNSDYRVMVGRSRSITGPYLDAKGVPMTEGGGTELLRGYNEFAGPGHGDVFRANGTDFFAHHYYDRQDEGAPKLSIRAIRWRNGWPRLGEPLSGSADVGHGSAYFEIVERNSGLVVENAGCGLEGANVQLGGDLDGDCQRWRLEQRGGGFVSINNRYSNKVAEVAGCVNQDAANIAQWGWLANDCQRFRLTATSGGWMRIQSALPGGRVMQAAGCGSARATNVQLGDPVAGRCQEFRLRPVGRVLLAAPDGPRVLAPARCGTGNRAVVGYRDAHGSRCEQWRFARERGTSSRILSADSRRALAVAGCRPNGALVAVPSAGAGSACASWRLEARENGSLAIVNVTAGRTERVRVLLP